MPTPTIDTASIAGEYEVAKAEKKQAGLIVAETMIDHGDFIKTFALLSDFEVRGNRVALIANAGYEKTYAADNLGRLQIATFDPATHDALAKLLPPYVTVDPLLDLTPMAVDAMYADCIRTILQSDTVDALMISIVPHSIMLHTTDDEIARTEGHLAERIVDLIHTYKNPPWYPSMWRLAPVPSTTASDRSWTAAVCRPSSPPTAP